METRATPALHPKRSPRETYRRYLGIGAALMITGMLASACWPGAAPIEPDRPVTVPPITEPASPPPPPVVEPPPVQPPRAEPPPTQPPQQPKPPTTPPPSKPPQRPAGEPTMLVVNGDRSCQQIALTYDAGSGADGAAVILDVLKKHGVTSTFFLTGRWVEKFPDLAKRIAAEGHEIANHTYSHPDLTKLSDAEVVTEVEKGEEAIRSITGQETKPLFREPYGAFNDHQRRLVRQAGFSYSVYWDVDTLDWQFPGVEAEVKKIMDKSRNGSIVLMHLNVPDSAAASDQVIPRLREQGYQLVTVSQVLTCP